MRQLDTTLQPVLDRLCSLAAGPIAIGVSGGGDSVALLHLVAEWARVRGRAVLSLTFDHGLRPASVREAAGVADLSAGLGIDHETLNWDAPMPGAATARRARHSALALAARDAGATHLLLGHTLDDQAETFLLRAGAGSGWYGLAGMDAVARSPVWPEGRGVTLARPLLSVSRQSLRDYLQALGARWIDDPSNEDAAYGRVRARNLLAAAPASAARIGRLQADFTGLRTLQHRTLARWMRRHVMAHQDAGLTVTRADLTDAQWLRALSWLIPMAAGTSVSPRRDAVQRLAAAMEAQGAARQTLGGAWIAKTADGLHLARDPGMVTGLDDGGTVWDGRFERDRDVFGTVSRSAAHPLSRASLPPESLGPWRALVPDRIAHLIACLSGTA